LLRGQVHSDLARKKAREKRVKKIVQQRIETLRAMAVREKRENEEKTPLKIHLKQVENL